MLNKDELSLICRESQKIGMKCVGEVDGEKVYRVCYETIEYYVDDECIHLYTVYNHNFNDYDTEILDLGASKVMRYLMMCKGDME